MECVLFHYVDEDDVKLYVPVEVLNKYLEEGETIERFCEAFRDPSKLPYKLPPRLRKFIKEMESDARVACVRHLFEVGRRLGGFPPGVKVIEYAGRIGI